jgi:hypothetical protein
LLDRALRVAFRNFATLFFIVAVVTVPLQAVYSYVFRDVIAVEDLHAEIREFTGDRQVRGVGPNELDDARLFGWIVIGIEIVLIPLLVRAAGRALETDEAGQTPTVSDAWSHAWRGPGLRRRPSPGVGGAFLGGLAVGAVVLVGVEASGRLLIENVADDYAWAAAAILHGSARAAGAPFFLASLVIALPKAKATGGVTPNLY